MIFASHNSLSYNKPQLLLRPFHWMGRCQSKDIAEQYMYGVRYFDIRVKFDEDYNPISGQGLFTYNIKIEGVLNFIAELGGCTARITLEHTRASNTVQELFAVYCETWQKLYPSVLFTGGCMKGRTPAEWKQIYKFNFQGTELDTIVEEKFWLFQSPFENPFGWFPYPKQKAIRNNARYKEEYQVHNDGTGALMLDFIEIGRVSLNIQ